MTGDARGSSGRTSPRHGVVAVLAGACLLAAAPAQAESRICRVADPTGTSLNIRLEPNGEIVASAPNRSRIQVFVGEGRRDNKGRLWHLVALLTSSAPDGFVLAAYVNCG